MASRGQNPWSDFGGFQLPGSNTTYTPNQFFDLVLRNAKTTGVVRAVAYVLRKTLGWSNSDGSPQETEIVTDYAHLMSEAGISRASIREALDECLDKKYLSCLRKARPDQCGKKAVSALYELAWDDEGDYTTDAEAFSGFFSGEGNRTYIPNQFFDLVIPNEKLSVIKVIGAIIRHTIGFQNRYGHRRKEVSMSITHLMRVTKMSRESVRVALNRAIELGCIVKTRAGTFDMSSEQANEATVYSINWDESSTILTAYADTGSESSTGQTPRDSGARKRTGSKSSTGEPVQNLAPTGSESGTGPVQDLAPHRNNILKIKPKETTTRGSTSAEGVVVFSGLDFLKRELRDRGVTDEMVSRLVGKFPPLEISDQIEAFDFLVGAGKAPKNPGGFLNCAITQNYPFPTGFKTARQKLQEAEEAQKTKEARAKQQRIINEREAAKRTAEEAEEKRREALIGNFLEKLTEDERAELEAKATGESGGIFAKSRLPTFRKMMLNAYVWELLEAQKHRQLTSGVDT